MNFFLNNMLSKVFGYRLIKGKYYKYLRKKTFSNAYEFLLLLEKFSYEPFLNLYKNHKSQLLQDVFVLLKLDFKKKGFFVEFGVGDGLNLSNTYMLEKEFKWKGIISEPARKFHKKIEVNRKNIILDKRAVFRVSGQKLLFNETENGEFSTLNQFSNSDLNAHERKKGNKYYVETVSLFDLLNQNSYERVYEDISKWDDWFIHKTLSLKKS